MLITSGSTSNPNPNLWPGLEPIHNAFFVCLFVCWLDGYCDLNYFDNNN